MSSHLRSSHVRSINLYRNWGLLLTISPLKSNHLKSNYKKKTFFVRSIKVVSLSLNQLKTIGKIRGIKQANQAWFELFAKIFKLFNST